MAQKIIKEQEGIIGPVALEQARKVPGLRLDWAKHEVKFEGDQKQSYRNLSNSTSTFLGEHRWRYVKTLLKI